MSSLEKDRQDLQSTIDALQEGVHAYMFFSQILIVYLLFRILVYFTRNVGRGAFIPIMLHLLWLKTFSLVENLFKKSYLFSVL
jgi:hypothetical protein